MERLALQLGLMERRKSSLFVRIAEKYLRQKYNLEKNTSAIIAHSSRLRQKAITIERMKLMKNKIIILIVWLALSAIYVWIIGDTGRAMGAQTKDAYEKYVEYYTKEYIGADGLAEGAADAWSYSYFNDLGSKFKFGMLTVSIGTVIYIALTLIGYHIAFNRKNNLSGD